MSRHAVHTSASASRVRLALVALALAIVLGVMAVGIALTHEQAKSQIVTNFKARGKASAEFVSTYLAQQATRETQSAEKFLAGRNDVALEFNRVATTFGSGVAGLFDSSGRVLAILPHDPAMIGSEVASK